jgi:phospholipase C
VDRASSAVTATLTNTGKVGVGFSVYPDAYVAATVTPVTVTSGATGSYTWDAMLTLGKYSFSVYGPDGFLTSFAGTVVPAAQTTGQIPVVTAALSTAGGKTVELTLASDGTQAVTYTLTPNDYKGKTRTVTVKQGSPRTVSWPTDAYGYYDVVITANTTDGFRRRYAGRVA